MDSTEERLVPERRGLDALSTLGKLGLGILSVRLVAVAVALICLCGVAGFVATYLSFESSSTEPSALIYRAASVNTATAAILSFVSLCVAGIAIRSSITARLEAFTRATQAASIGDLDARIGAAQGPVLEGLARSFNSMMDRMSETARSEAAQKQSLLVIIKAVEASGDAIAVADSSRERTYYNKKFTELFGSEFDEVTHERSRLYVDPKVAGEVSRAVANGDSWSGEVEMRAKSGKIIPVALRADAIKDDGGQVTGRIEIHTDITQRKRADLLQSALYRVAEMTNATDDIQAIFSAVHRIVAELMYAGNFFIALYDPATETVELSLFR